MLADRLGDCAHRYNGALQFLKPPSWNAGLGDLILTGIVLFVICLWMSVGTIGATVRQPRRGLARLSVPDDEVHRSSP